MCLFIIFFAAGSNSVELLEPSNKVRRTRFLRFGLQTSSIGTYLISERGQSSKTHLIIMFSMCVTKCDMNHIIISLLV